MGVAEVWYTRTDSPIGVLTLVATPTGLAAISFGDGDATSRRPDDAHRAAGERAGRTASTPCAASWTSTSRGGARSSTCRSTAASRPGSGARAQEAISRIPYGAVASYGDIAAGAGQPGATRAAGTACRTNPIPVMVPCHRVLRSDGSIGGYAGDMAGGLDIKRHLLALEGVQLTLFVPYPSLRAARIAR